MVGKGYKRDFEIRAALGTYCWFIIVSVGPTTSGGWK